MFAFVRHATLKRKRKRKRTIPVYHTYPTTKPQNHTLAAFGRNKREPSIKLLYVTPERLLKSQSFQDLLTFLHEHVSFEAGVRSFCGICGGGALACVLCAVCGCG